MPNRFESLSDDEKAAICAELDALYQKKPVAWKKWLKSRVAPDPMLWMHATIHAFEQNPEFIHRWAVFQRLLTDPVTSAQHQAMWTAYLHHLAHNRRLKNSHTQWHIKKHFTLIPREYEQAVLDQALLGASGPMTVPMLEHYYAVRCSTPAVFVQSLKHKSKKVRDAALQAAHRWPADADPALIVALLKERKKDTRLYAAMALANLPLDRIRTQREALQGFADKEKVAAVSDALTGLIARIDG